MRARILIGAAAAGSMVLVLVVMCVVVAQNPPTRSRTKAPQPADLDVTPALSPNALPPAPARFGDAEIAAPESPVVNLSGDPTTAVYSRNATSPRPARPAVIELKSGLKLAGQLAAAPIPCDVVFGQAALPLETIRGIRMSDEVVSDGGEPRSTSAIIVLENGDSLTGMPRLEVIHLQTEWGEAIVKLSHLKTVVLAAENVVWEERDGRWRLVPAPQSQPDSQPEQRNDAASPPSIDSGAGPTPSPLNPATAPAAPTVPAPDSLR